jgi:hypothetical protein
VLIDGRNLWKLHGRWLVFTAVATLVAVLWTVIAWRANGRWPGGGSVSGLALGSVAAAIFFFELALVAKKTKAFRTARWLLSAQTWMKAHIWLGLLTVPLVVLHSGGRLGGTLTTLFVLVFAAVIASGIWGLMLQNVLPRLLLEAAPAETVYSEIDRVARQYAAEAHRLALLACGTGDEMLPSERSLVMFEQAAPARGDSRPIPGFARAVGLQIERSPHPARELPRTIPSPAIQDALRLEIGPFLETGTVARGILGSRQRNEWYFDDLRLRVVPELRTLVGQLEELCERRRQLNLQQRLHYWLHNWLWLHLPLSLGLMILLAVHIVFALRFG